MKAIIKNGVVNKDIQSCLISECGSGIPCVNNGNKVTISYIDQLVVHF